MRSSHPSFDDVVTSLAPIYIVARARDQEHQREKKAKIKAKELKLKL